MKTIHIANEADGSYNVHKPLPYPYHIEDDGTVGRQDFWKGKPARLLGFQLTADRHEVSVRVETWLENDVDVTGHFPVFQDKNGAIWSLTLPVSKEG